MGQAGPDLTTPSGTLLAPLYYHHLPTHPHTTTTTLPPTSPSQPYHHEYTRTAATSTGDFLIRQFYVDESD